MGDLGDDRAEALGDGDAAALALGQGGAPARHLGRAVEGGAEPGVLVHQVAPVLVGVSACGVGHLVDERLLEEAVLRVQHRAPRALADVVRRAPAVEAPFGDGVGHEQRLAVAAARVVGPHREGAAVGGEGAGVAAHRGGPVVAVLDVVLAAPDQLDGGGRHGLRDARGEVDVVEAERQAPAVAAAEHQVRQLDLARVEVEGARGGGAGVQGVLGARPHLGAVALDAGGARHRLHGGVGEERDAVVGGDDLGGILGHLRGVAEGLVERREDGLARDAAVARVVVPGAERREGLAGAPVAVSDHRDRLVELDDLLNAGHRLRRGGVDRHEPASLDGRDVDGRVEHAGQGEVDAVGGAAVDFRGDVEARLPGAPDGVGVGVLQGRVRRGGHRRRRLREVAEARALARPRVGDARPLGPALVDGDPEALGRGREQHLAGRRARHLHAVAGAAHRERAAGGLGAEPAREAVGAVVDGASDRRGHRVAGERAQHVGVGVGVEGRRLADAHPLPVGLHLLGRHHRERGLRPLSHLAVGNQDGDEIVGGDGDPGRQFALVGGVGRDDAVAARRDDDAGDPEDEAAAGEGPGPDEGTARPLTHDAPPLRPRRPRRRGRQRSRRRQRRRWCRPRQWRRPRRWRLPRHRWQPDDWRLPRHWRQPRYW